LRALVRQDSRFYGGREAAETFIGKDPEELKAGSPIHGTEKIGIPVLLVHGTADINVVVDHSRNMARALAEANKPHELVIIQDSDHSLSRGSWRQTSFAKLEAFLAANLGPGPIASAAQ
jgi:dipeptidyl aminopeptidase/acylaminoacyl peptidase